MASRTTTDPIDILLEMGVDLDNLSEEEDYLSALMEAVNTLTIKDAKDPRIAFLQQEILKVRKKRFSEARKTKNIDPKKLENPETIWSNIKYDGPQAKKTTIKPDAFFNKKSEEVRDNVKTGAIDSKKLKFSSVNIAPKQQALPTSAIVPYEEPQAEEVKEKKKEEPRNLLAEIAASVTNIADTLKNQYNLKKKEGEFDRKKAQRDKRKLDEKNLEKGFGTLLKSAQKIIKPVKGFFDRIFDFIKAILIGKFLMGLIDFVSKPENQKKLQNIIAFLGKHWKKLLSLYLVFGTGLGRFVFSLTKLLIGGAIKLTVAVAKLLAAKKLVSGFGARKLARFLGGTPGKILAAGLTTATVVGGTYAGVNALTGSGQEQQTQGFSGGGLAQPKIQPTPQAVKKDSPKGMPSAMKGAALGSLLGPLGMLAGAGIGSLFDKFSKKKDDTVTLSKPANIELNVPSGTEGQVDGPGGTDKVPAMLTAGEFVMSRGAVQKFGVQTLEGMNAAGGGTNQPKVINNKVFAYGGGFVGFDDGKVPNTANVDADQRGQSSLSKWSKMSGEDKRNVLKKYRERQLKSVKARYRYLADMQSKGLDAYGRPIKMINSPSVNIRDISNIEVRRGSGSGSPQKGYVSEESSLEERKETSGFKDFKERYIVGDESFLNKLALGDTAGALETLGIKIDNNTKAVNQNTDQQKKDSKDLRQRFEQFINNRKNDVESVGSGVTGFLSDRQKDLESVGSGVTGFLSDRQKDLESVVAATPGFLSDRKKDIESGMESVAEFGQGVVNSRLNPLYGIGEDLTNISKKSYFGEDAIDKLTQERIASGELGEDGLGLTKTTQANLDKNDAYIRSLYDPEKDTGFMGHLKKMNQTMQNKGAVADPLALIGLKEEGTEKFIEKITGGRVKNFGAKLTGLQMAVKGLAGPLGRAFQIDDRGSLGRYLRPAMEEAQRQGHTSVGREALGGDTYDRLVNDKLANLALGQVHFEVDEQGRAKTSDVFDASAMTPKQYLEASRKSLGDAGSMLMGKEVLDAKGNVVQGGPVGIAKALYQSAFMGLSGRLATAQNSGFGNLRPMGLDIDLGGGFTPKKTPESEKKKQSTMNMIMGGKDAYYSSTTNQYYKNYAEALKDPKVAAAAQVEKTKQRLSFSPEQKPKSLAPEPPQNPSVNVIQLPSKKHQGGQRAAPGGGSYTPNIDAGSGSSSKRKILGIF